MSQENVEIVRRLFEAWNEGDLEGTIASIHPECVFDASDRVFNPDIYVGHDGIRRFAQEVGDVWQRFGFHAEGLLDAGDRVVALGRGRGKGRGSGIELGQEIAFVCTVRDGLLTHSRLYQNQDEARQAAGLG